MLLPDQTPLVDARHAFWGAAKKGAECPCCGRYGKVYKRKLNAGMARILIVIYHMDRMWRPRNGWLHVSKEFLKWKKNAVAEEYSKLRFWGLLEPMPNGDPTVPGTGYWRITDLGREFVEDKVEISRHVFVFDNKVIDASQEWTSIRNALGDKFDYDELMQDTP